MKDRPRVAAAALAGVLCAAAIAYGPAIDGELHSDDVSSIVEDWSIRDPVRVLGEIRPLELLGPDRPVTQVSLALDYARGMLDPRPYHVTSLVLHLGTAVLVYLLAAGALRRVQSRHARWIALVVSAAFALHPLQTESVAFAAQRSEVLAAGLGLGALLALVAADERGSRRTAWGLVALATALHLLALGAKVVAVATPAAFVLHQLVVPARDSVVRARLRRALALSAPLWLLTAAAVTRSIVLLGPGETAGLGAGTLGPWRYLLTQVRVHWRYARLVVWPVGQNVDHAFDASPGLLHLPTAIALLATLAVLAGAVALWRRAEIGLAEGTARVVLFGIGFFLVELAPSSSFVPIADPVAEHRVYLASAGLLLAVLAAADWLVRRIAPERARWVEAVLAAGTLLALGAALHARAEVWRSDEALWTDAVRKNPASALGWANLGHTYHARGEAARAFAAYGLAETLAKQPALIGVVAANLSAIYGEQGELDRALATLERGLAAAPRYPPLHNNRAAVLWKLGRLGEARRAALRAIELERRGYPQAHHLLGLILLDEDDAGGALEELREARRLDPDTLAYAENELVALSRLGRREEACLAWTAIRRSGRLAQSGAGARALARSLKCR